MARYTVDISGKTGRVYEGPDLAAALEEFKEFLVLSESGEGEAEGQNVAIYQDGRLLCRHVGYSNT